MTDRLHYACPDCAEQVCICPWYNSEVTKEELSDALAAGSLDRFDNFTRDRMVDLLLADRRIEARAAAERLFPSPSSTVEHEQDTL